MKVWMKLNALNSLNGDYINGSFSDGGTSENIWNYSRRKNNVITIHQVSDRHEFYE